VFLKETVKEKKITLTRHPKFSVNWRHLPKSISYSGKDKSQMYRLKLYMSMKITYINYTAVYHFSGP